MSTKAPDKKDRFTSPVPTMDLEREGRGREGKKELLIIHLIHEYW